MRGSSNTPHICFRGNVCWACLHPGKIHPPGEGWGASSGKLRGKKYARCSNSMQLEVHIIHPWHAAKAAQVIIARTECISWSIYLRCCPPRPEIHPASLFGRIWFMHKMRARATEFYQHWYRKRDDGVRSGFEANGAAAAQVWPRYVKSNTRKLIGASCITLYMICANTQVLAHIFVQIQSEWSKKWRRVMWWMPVGPTTPCECVGMYNANNEHFVEMVSVVSNSY